MYCFTPLMRLSQKHARLLRLPWQMICKVEMVVPVLRGSAMQRPSGCWLRYTKTSVSGVSTVRKRVSCCPCDSHSAAPQSGGTGTPAARQSFMYCVAGGGV